MRQLGLVNDILDLSNKPDHGLGYKYVLLRWQDDVAGGLESA